MAFRCFHQTAFTVCLNDIRLRCCRGVRRRWAWLLRALLIALAVTFGLTITFGLPLAVLAFLFFATRLNFASRLAEQTQIMFGVLLKVLRSDPVAGQM